MSVLTFQTENALIAPTRAPAMSLVRDTDFDILLTEVGNARRLLRTYGSDICYHRERDCWYVWTGTHWAADNKKSHSVCLLLKKVLQDLRTKAEATIAELTPVVADMPDDKDNRTPEHNEIAERLKKAKQNIEWSIRSESDRCVAGSVRQAASEPDVTLQASEFDKNPYLFNVLNGTYDLQSNTFREHRREDYITHIAPVVYDPSAGWAEFEKFLMDIFPDDEDLPEYMQRLFGYSLSGLTTERVIPFLMGTGTNGKSVLCNVVSGVMGKEREGYAMEANFRTFTMARYAEPDKPRNDVMRFQGKRLITASESDDPGAKMDTEILKRISGNDDLTGRGNYQEDGQFKPQCKVFLRMNNEPRILDSTESIWCRVKKIKFTRVFSPTEIDPDLTDKLLQGESSGVLNWLIAGWKKVQTAWANRQVALPDPPSVSEATGEYRENQSAVIRFFQQNFRVAQSESKPLSASAIYESYSKWALEQGEKYVKSQMAFGLELQRHLAQYKTVHKKRKSGDGKILWCGIESLQKFDDEEALF